MCMRLQMSRTAASSGGVQLSSTATIPHSGRDACGEVRRSVRAKRTASIEKVSRWSMVCYIF
jgi:hypothetical protein